MKQRLVSGISFLLVAFNLHAAVPACEQEAGRKAELIEGAVSGGELFQTQTPGNWIFRLTPIEKGWLVGVSQPAREDEDISRLTPPWHGPNHRVLEGWQFRNIANRGPNDGSVNEPQELRFFIFSPEVGRTIQYIGTDTTAEAVDEVESYGRGWLYLNSYTLTPPAEGERAAFDAITFTACLTWPE